MLLCTLPLGLLQDFPEAAEDCPVSDWPVLLEAGVLRCKQQPGMVAT